MIQSYKDRKFDYTSLYEVYRNLHNNKFSIRDKKTKLVVAHGNDFFLNVIGSGKSKAGQKKAKLTGVRNVHLWLVGNLIEVSTEEVKLLELTYNPFLHSEFIFVDESEFETGIYYFLDGKCYKVLQN